MAILLDPPTWPAHGTIFSHLISDSSIDELHAFARSQNISLRAFDLDHYDVPAHLYNSLLEAGAQPVTGAQLTRSLIASGLRIPFKERPKKIRRMLLRSWNTRVIGYEDLGEYLLDCWEESHRAYHNSAHLLEMLDKLDILLPKVRLELFLATWLHDIVYKACPGEDERASAETARDLLAPLVKGSILSSLQVDAVAQLIEITACHSAVEIGGLSINEVEAFLDADMSILAAHPSRYARYIAGIRSEYSTYSEQKFSAGRVAFLSKTLAREKIFSTAKARNIWEETARLNMGAELASLQEAG